MKDYITVEFKTVWGNPLIYPVDDQAFKFLKLLRPQKTFTPDNIEDIKALGYEVRLKPLEKETL